jgi:pimeloyl-ACP methyl ester carboxylesterase
LGWRRRAWRETATADALLGNDVNRQFTVALVMLSAFAVFLPMRSQTFTRVEIDGRAIRMLVSGTGASTVVFENGLGPPLEMWGKVQPHVSQFATTVTYDRAGVGLSEDGPSPRDGQQIARELHKALGAAGLPPPYVLVGASLGGLYIRVFAGTYPEDVSGMVLVDPTHDADGFERSLHPELSAARETAEQARRSPIPPGVPLVLIDAVGQHEVPFATSAIRELRAKNRPEIDAESNAYKTWLDTIPDARLIVTNESGHNVPIEQPQLVVETIREIVRATRDQRRRSVRALVGSE